MSEVFGGIGMAVVADAYVFVGVAMMIGGDGFEDISGCVGEFVDVIGGCGWICLDVSSLILQQIDFANFSFPALTKCRLSVWNSCVFNVPFGSTQSSSGFRK